jgi:hypothetical protein
MLLGQGVFTTQPLGSGIGSRPHSPHCHRYASPQVLISEWIPGADAAPESSTTPSWLFLTRIGGSTDRHPKAGYSHGAKS